MTEHRIHVPAREGRAVRVEAGRSFRVIDLDGGQVGDLFAFCLDDLGEYLSAEPRAPRTSGSSRASANRS